MKKYLLLLAILSLLISNFILSCKSLPEIEPANPAGNQFVFSFLKEPYQLTHSIKAELPNGDKTLLIGVTEIDPDLKAINAVIMTVEGLVLFDVTYVDNSASINRSIPEFDKSGFAEGLIDDLNLIYFTPDCIKSESGRLEGKDMIRYKCKSRGNAKGTVIDVLTNKDTTAEIRKYNSSNSLIRTVKFLSISRKGLPEKIELVAYGLFSYSLYMELISAEKL